MPITQFTNVPGRGQDQGTFAARADNFLGVQLPRFVVEANGLAAEVNAMTADARTATTAAALQAAASAGVAEAAVQGLANYRGEWSALSGSLTPPASVRHKGRLWLLTQSTPNVALSEPGVDVSRWEPALRGMVVTAASMTALHGDEIVSTAGGAITVTLPLGPSSGDTVSVVRMGAGVVTVARNGSTILGVADNLVLDKQNWRILFVFAGGTWRISMEGVTA